MERREFELAGRKYLLVARGEPSDLICALDLAQRMIERADAGIVGGILEIAGCTVTIQPW